LKFREKYFSTNIIKVVKNLFNGGLGIGDWGLGIGPNPQSPIPNPQNWIKIFIFSYCKKYTKLNK
jgi:hypothetical protein